MAGSPTFLGDGHDPRRSDSIWTIEQKILGAISDGGGSGTGNLSGVGSPEGAVTANIGTLYVQTNTTPPSIWAKQTGSGNTGWAIEIEGV